MSTAASPAKRRTLRSRAPARVAALAGLFLLGACGALGRREAPAHEREIAARTRELEQLFRAGDLLGVADVYADDGVLLDARGERTAGREEIDDYWSAIESPVDWRLETREIGGSGVIAYQTGTSRLTTRREGELHTSVNDFLVLWRREPNGSWRIELDAYWPAAGH
jgi:uncharacterized protein (TIGR02246 family)